MTILLFAVAMGRLWMFLASKEIMTNDIDKFNLAFIIIAIIFIVVEVFFMVLVRELKFLLLPL